MPSSGKSLAVIDGDGEVVPAIIIASVIPDCDGLPNRRPAEAGLGIFGADRACGGGGERAARLSW